MSDLLDPRQRIAAAALLCAIDLPADMGDVTTLWKLAGRIAPRGASVQEVAIGSTRRGGLERARDIINDMLAELDAKEKTT